MCVCTCAPPIQNEKPKAKYTRPRLGSSELTDRWKCHFTFFVSITGQTSENDSISVGKFNETTGQTIYNGTSGQISMQRQQLLLITLIKLFI